MNVRKFYIHALIIVSIVMVGISPACAFISGESSIEICAPDGTLQTIEVDKAFDPFAEIPSIADHLEAMEQCSYCFSFDHVKAFALQGQQFDAVLPSYYLVVSSGMAIPEGSQLTLYQPRGPPTFS